MSSDPTANDLRRQSKAAADLIAMLKADGHDDEQLLTDMTEGDPRRQAHDHQRQRATNPYAAKEAAHG